MEARCVFGSFALRVHHLGGTGSCSTMKPPSSWNGDRRHPTAAKFVLDCVAVGQRSFQTLKRIGHGLRLRLAAPLRWGAWDQVASLLKQQVERATSLLD